MEEIYLLSQREAAEYVNVSRQTVYNWIKKGRLPLYYPSCKVNKKKLGGVNPKDLDKLI